MPAHSVAFLSATLTADVAYCQVLLNAFGRALKDGFPPARVAALRAITATLKHYSPEEVACRAMPAVAPLAVDQLTGQCTTSASAVMYVHRMPQLVLTFVKQK